MPDQEPGPFKDHTRQELSVNMTQSMIPPMPIWLLVLLALAAGLLLAVGSLGYSPEGRINVFHIWLLWAGLPLIGALVSLLWSLQSTGRPWLFRLAGREFSWFPEPRARWQMLLLLQQLWCLVAVGMLLGFGFMLLFTDLAFGWSSTVLTGEQSMVGLAQTISLPWQWLWSSAAPDADLITATRFQRIAPEQATTERAGDWWPFLLASLLFYNLLPRLGLAGLAYWQLRRLNRTGMVIRGSSDDSGESQPDSGLVTAPLGRWTADSVLKINWEQTQSRASCTLGDRDWAADLERLNQVLAEGPRRLLWQVAVQRSPVAELSDLVAHAQSRGVTEQGLYAVPSGDTVAERHLVSWQAFARRHGLVWVVDDNEPDGQESGL